MPASPKRSTKRQPRPVRPDPWSGWIDAAVGIGHAFVAYELMFVAALSPLQATRRANPRLVLVHSSATVAAARPCARPVLLSVQCRDEGKD